WARDKFPFEVIPKLAALGIGGVGYQGYGSAGGFDLSLRGRRAERAVACNGDGVWEGWGGLAGRTAGWVRGLGGGDDDLSARKRRLGPQRREKMDRQCNLRGHQCDLGA